MILLLVPLSGCGIISRSYDESFIRILDDGRVESVIVSDFPEDEYNIDAFKDMVYSEMASYNSSHERGSVKLKNASVKEGKISVVMQYKSAEDYADFNGSDLFYGTVYEAISKGLPDNVVLKNTLGNNTVTNDNLSDLGFYHMLIIDEATKVIMPSSVLYASANVELLGADTAQMSDESSGTAYLIIK